MDRHEALSLLARWFMQDECRSEVSPEDEQSAASLLRYLNHTHGVYLARSMPAGYYVAGGSCEPAHIDCSGGEK